MLLHKVHLLSQFAQLELERLHVVIALGQLLRQVLISAGQLLDLPRGGHVELGHFLLQELDLVVLVLKLVLE